MKTLPRRGALLALLLMGPGCTKSLVTVHYRQILNARAFVENNSYYASQGKYVVYQVTQIENKDSKAIPFYFKLDKVYVRTDDNDYVQAPVTQPSGTMPMTDFQAAPGATVAPGGATDYLGDFAINIPSSQHGVDEHAAFNLLYRSDPGESVVMVRDPALRPVNAPQTLAPGEVYWRDTVPQGVLADFLACNRTGKDTQSQPCVPQ